MIKHLTFCISLLSIYCYSQSENNNRFKLNAGVEYRITPYDLGNREGFFMTEYYYNSNRDKHLSGTSLNLELEYFFLKNTSLGLMQNLRYDELYAALVLKGNSFEASDTKKRFIADTGIFLKHYINLKNEDKAIFGSLGYAFMNNNTNFSTKRLISKDENGELIFTDAKVNFKFQSIYLGLGYKYKDFEVVIGNYFVGKNSDPFYASWHSEGFGLPFIKLNYNVVNF